MIKKLAVLAVIMVFSGCICCGGKDFSNLMPGKKTPSAGASDNGGPENAGGVTDTTEPQAEQSTDTTLASDEGGQTTDTTLADEGAAATATTTTEASAESATSTQQPTTTTASTAHAATYECVRAAGYNPDHVIFGFSQGCGDKFVSTASTVSIQKGVNIDAIKIGGVIDDKKVQMLECFYGNYTTDNTLFSQCPVLMCPKTGEVKVLSGLTTVSVKSQMEGFSAKCV